MSLSLSTATLSEQDFSLQKPCLEKRKKERESIVFQPVQNIDLQSLAEFAGGELNNPETENRPLAAVFMWYGAQPQWKTVPLEKWRKETESNTKSHEDHGYENEKNPLLKEIQLCTFIHFGSLSKRLMQAAVFKWVLTVRS